MKTLLALLILLGAGGYYLYTLRDENAKMKSEMDKMSEMMSDEDRARIAGGGGSGPGRGVHKRMICTLCKGEGSVMVRRTVNASLADVKTMCALCMGAGKREFDVPNGSEVCPDCNGMGKRVIYAPKTRSLRNTGLSNEIDGYAGQAPSSTSCTRCLGKGSIVRPGLK